ncbi:MAG: LamG domain-containing protein [Candidatus Saccharimonadales bacterium]
MNYENDESQSSGFTIVELLVVIVVIGILAAITIVSYSGISQRATVASLTSDLDSASRQLKLYQVTSDTSSYPTSFDVSNCPIPADNARCLKPSSGISYTSYVFNNSITPQGFCITAAKDLTIYRVTNDSAPVQGDCLEYGQVLHLDAGNTSSYPSPFNGTAWADLSGNNNNGTLINGVVYSGANGGIFNFDGATSYVNIPGNSTLEPQSVTIVAWINMSTSAPTARNIFLTKWNGYSCEVEATTRRPYFRLNGPGDVYSSDNLVLGNWYQFVGTFEKGVGAKIYLNGALKGSRSTPAGISYTANSVLNIGRYAGGVYFKGSISDVRIYNRALGVDEINQLFNAIHDRYGV